MEGMNILKMAEQIAAGIPQSEKDNLAGMDMEKMLGAISKNVFSHMKDINFEDLANGLPPTPPPTKKKKKRRRKKKPMERTKDLCCQLDVSLKDMYVGKTKKISILRQTYDDERPEGYQERKQFPIEIFPGMMDQHVITLKDQGDRVMGCAPGDINITICEKVNEMFERIDDNLFMDQQISLAEVYFLEYQFKHIDGRIVKIEPLANGDLQNEGMKKITGMGFVDPETGERGDMFIRFDIVLPPTLSEEYAENLRTLFPPIATQTTGDSSVTMKLEAVSAEDHDLLDDMVMDGEYEDDDSDDVDDDSDIEDTLGVDDSDDLEEDLGDDLGDEDSDDLEEDIVEILGDENSGDDLEVGSENEQSDSLNDDTE